MSDELKPCPFCGGDNKHMDDCYIPMLIEYVERKQFLDPDDEKKLEKAWNTRAERTCNAEQDYDAMDDGIPDCRIWKCSCGESFPFWRGLNPCFCPKCGAKVIN